MIEYAQTNLLYFFSTMCGEFPVPSSHLGPCHTCDRRGRNCGLVDEGGEGVKDADFVLYVSAVKSRQCGEAIGEYGMLINDTKGHEGQTYANKCSHLPLVFKITIYKKIEGTMVFT